MKSADALGYSLRATVESTARRWPFARRNDVSRSEPYSQADAARTKNDAKRHFPAAV
jgi:hypothetical protein